MIVASSCLAGVPCRYNSTAKPDARVVALVRGGKAIHACPELLGGMRCPRPPAEITGGDGRDVLAGYACVYNSAGENITHGFVTGAHSFFDIVRKNDAEQVLLKANSPSCGITHIYDGTFSGRLVPGCGVTAALLLRHGVHITEIP